MRKTPDEKRHGSEQSEEVVRRGEAIYRELKKEGKLNGRAGKGISIDTKYGFFGIGHVFEAHRQLEALITWRRGKKEILDPHWARDRVYNRRIGLRDEIPTSTMQFITGETRKGIERELIKKERKPRPRLPSKKD